MGAGAVHLAWLGQSKPGFEAIRLHHLRERCLAELGRWEVATFFGGESGSKALKASDHCGGFSRNLMFWGFYVIWHRGS